MAKNRLKSKIIFARNLVNSNHTLKPNKVIMTVWRLMSFSDNWESFNSAFAEDNHTTGKKYSWY